MAGVTILTTSRLVISLVSDAGTPSISDPGAVLIRACVKSGIKIIPIPGASAVSAASIYHFTEKTPEEAKNYLKEQGIMVRQSIQIK